MEIGKVTVSGIEVLTILHMNITAAVGEHAKLLLECRVDEDKLQDYLQLAEQEKVITVQEEDTVLFCGYVTTVACSVNQDYAQITLTVMSATKRLDKEKKTRSFQNTKKTYLETVEVITPCILRGENRAIGEIAIQYRETDWEFIKRLASRAQAQVYADMTKSNVYVQWGIEEGASAREISVQQASARKDFALYYAKKENGVSALSEEDALAYEIVSDDFCKVGDCISYEGRRLYISELACNMDHAAFRAKYIARTAASFQVQEQYLYDLAGAALEGKILAVQGDKVQVHLSVDATQEKADAYWFPFSTMQSATDGSGWYYMPEVGDCVKVCLPGWEERGAFAVSAVSTYQADGDTEDKMADTSVKYMRNPSGKQIQLTPNAIKADGGGGASLLAMDTEGNIKLKSEKTLEITASEMIEIYAGKAIEMQASKILDIKADTTGELLLDENGEIKQLGGQVNINSEE